jgi:hypothetical protein
MDACRLCGRLRPYSQLHDGKCVSALVSECYERQRQRLAKIQAGGTTSFRGDLVVPPEPPPDDDGQPQ